MMWLGRIIILLSALLVMGALYQRIATTVDQNNNSPPGELVDVDGHKLHLYCQGTGSPTVVLESGLGETWLNWNIVHQALATFTRVCSYDRAGFGWSEPVPAPVLSREVATSLHTLLKNAAIASPYVLVGHSVGGIHVRSFAYQYPDDVAGMVLVDSSHESQRLHHPDGAKPIFTLCRVLAPFGMIRLLNLAEGWAQTNPYVSSEQHNMLEATMNQTHYCRAFQNEERAANADMSQTELHHLGDLPLTVLSATQTANRQADKLPAEIIEQVNALQAKYQLELTALSINSQQIFAQESGHYIHYDQPELVVEAIQQMVSELRP